MDVYGKPERKTPYAAIFIGVIIFLIILAGLVILSGDETLCVVCQDAKAHCHNGYRINEDCTERIYGYKCTNDGQNITYMCSVS